MELFGIADNVRKFSEKSREEWKFSPTPNDERLGEADVKGKIFLGDSLSLLSFILGMIPLALILRR